MRAMLIEDEPPALARLERGILTVVPDAQIVARVDSNRAAEEWLRRNPEPDLIFCDIQLADGLSFSLFERVNVRCPVVFCTAYDEFLTRAFEANAIDYLLKPLEQAALEAALRKYHQLYEHFAGSIAAKLARIEPARASYRQRFLIKQGARLVAAPTERIDYLRAEHKLVTLVDADGETYLLDRPLADIVDELDPARFFRANRSYVIALHAIEAIRSHGRGRLAVDVRNCDGVVVVSRENAARFRAWLDR